MSEDWETVTDVVSGAAFTAAINESRPRDGGKSTDHGQTSQRVTLLLPTRRRLNPPMRVRLPDGVDVRVLGSQLGPSWDRTTLATCERVNPDLPDEVELCEVTRGELDPVTNRHTDTLTPIWRGAASIIGADPDMVDAAGERAALDQVTIALPLDAKVAPELVCRVLASRHPSVAGASYRLAGEVDSSTAELRQVMANRLEP